MDLALTRCPWCSGEVGCLNVTASLFFHLLSGLRGARIDPLVPARQEGASGSEATDSQKVHYCGARYRVNGQWTGQRQHGRFLSLVFFWLVKPAALSPSKISFREDQRKEATLV